MILLKLLISTINEKEAIEAIAGGTNIVDVKNPKEGTLGANYPWIIRQIRQITPKNIEVSCTLGEIGNLPGSASLLALGAASLDVDYIKVGLRGLKTSEESVFLLKNVIRAAREYNPEVKVVVTGYADAKSTGDIDPLSIPKIAHDAGVDVAMIDTAIKNDNNLFTYLSIKQLRDFINSAHDFSLEAALAGSLRKQDLTVVRGLGVDIAGLRGAACTNSDRLTGQITRKQVTELVQIINEENNAKYMWTEN